MQPFVSIIVTVYQRLDYLREALDGVAAQSFTDYEVILADDSGDARARALADEYQARLPLRHRPNPTTLGVAASLRGALTEARGQTVCILNDDDAWEPGYLAALARPFQTDPRCVVAFCDHWLMREDGSIDAAASDGNSHAYGRLTLPGGPLADPAALAVRARGVPLAMASMFRRGAVAPARLDDRVGGAYDYWLCCLFAATGGSFHYVPERLSRYRVHARMETVRPSPDKYENMVFIYGELLREDWFPALRSFLRARLAEAHFRAGRAKAQFRRSHQARRSFWASFTTRPNLRAMAGWLLTLRPRRAPEASDPG